MALGGRWWLSELRGFKGLNLGVVESPYGTTREYHTQGRSLLVNRNSKHLQEALEFERFMASDAYLDLVNAQADGLGAFKRADNKPSFLFNREYPSERFNRVWRDIAGLGVKDDTSPFVDANSAEKLIQDQLDLVQGNQKSPEQAMRDAASNIEAAMKKAIAEDPSLAERYRAATRR
jgi:ABC-type glycerol-3-phosphate transport system substrate-binding protein